MSEDNSTIIFYRRLPNKNTVYTILVCPFHYVNMTKKEYINLMKDKPYTLSITNARRIAKKMDQQNHTKRGIQECVDFLDIDESLIEDCDAESTIEDCGFDFEVVEKKKSNSIHIIETDQTSTLKESSSKFQKKMESHNDILSEFKRLYLENHSLKEQKERVQKLEFELKERERILKDRAQLLSLQEKELNARVKELKSHESSLSLSYILSTFDLTEEELRETLSALKSQHRSTRL